MKAEKEVEPEKDRAAVALGRRGGKARWAGIGKAERTRLMRWVVLARWPASRKKMDPAAPRSNS